MSGKRIIFCCIITGIGLSQAQAQSTVQVAGLVDAYAGSMRMAGDAARRSVVNSGGMTTSWFGFLGSEDLGNGLKANFALTSFFQTDTGVYGRFTGDTLFSRDAYVGLSGEWGAFNLGRGKAPNFLPTILFNPFGDSFAFSPLVLHANVPLFNATAWARTTPSDTGWSNQITYTTPKWSGLSANLHYQMGEQAKTNGSSGKQNVGMNVLYANGPLALTAFYERAQVSNPVPVALDATQEDWMLGGAYDMKFVKMSLTYGEAKAKDALFKAKTSSVGATVPMGEGKLLAAWAHTQLTNGGPKRDTVSVGYDYDVSKRTDLYAVVMRDKITAFSSGTSLGVGMRHRF